MNIPDNKLIIEIKQGRIEKALSLFRLAIRGLIILFLVFLIGNIFQGEKMISSDFSTKYVDWYGNEVSSLEISQDAVALIPIRGMIMNQNMMALNDGVASESILKMLHDAEINEQVKAIVLHIDSPGGTVLDSEKIAQKIEEIKQKKKVYALFESTAASGAYYLASQADKIFAYKETLTGSIGVIMELPNAKNLMDKVGVKVNAITSGNMKTMGSPYEDLSDETKKVFQSLVDESFERFVERVAKGRNISAEDVKKLADGRVYSGTQALKNGLIDGVGGAGDVQAELTKQKLGTATLLEYFIPQSPLEEMLKPLQSAMYSFFLKNTTNATMYYRMP